MNVEGATALVTGANRGIGRELVTQLLERGVDKVYAAARDPRSVLIDDPRVHPVRLDLSDPTSIDQLATEVGDVDILVNNAGISLVSPMLSTDDTALRAEMQVNFFGPVRLAAQLADGIADRRGAVVNVASVASWFAFGGSYSASKAAVWSATDSLRIELEPRGVQVVGVYMGYVDTDMTESVTSPKIAPADLARQVLDALESGADEVIGDQTAAQARAALPLPVRQRYADFLAPQA